MKKGQKIKMKIVVYTVMNVYGELLYIGEKAMDNTGNDKTKVANSVENRNALQNAFIWGNNRPKEIGCHQVTVSCEKSKDGKAIFKVLSCKQLVTLY